MYHIINKAMDSIAANSRVLFDKVTDYIGYYGRGKFLNAKDQSDLSNEEILNKRIFTPVGKMNECRGYYKEPTHIVDNIYLGSGYNAASYNCLNSYNIKCVVNMAHELRNYHQNVEYYKKGVYDDNKDKLNSDDFEDVYNYIVNMRDKLTNEDGTYNGNILIHCFMGASRSAIIMAYYLVKNSELNDEEIEIEQAIEYIKSKRDHVNPTYRLLKDAKRSLNKEEE